MNRDESIALFKQGREAWNAWAADMVTEREALEEGRRWLEEGTDDKLTEEAKRWHEKAVVDFSGLPFEDDADFSRCSFPGQVSFERVIFKGEARFGDATFRGDASFDGAHFEGFAGFVKASFEGKAEFDSACFEGKAGFSWALFEGHTRFVRARFKGDTWFESALFEDDTGFGEASFEGFAGFGGTSFEDFAWFSGVRFKGDAQFESARFEDDAHFESARFEGDARFDSVRFEGDTWFRFCRFSGAADLGRCRFVMADFRAIAAVSAFSLTKAEFQAVPDFVQSHFSEAPRCDDLSIAVRGLWWRLIAHLKWRFARGRGSADTNKPLPLLKKADPDLPARWRALKRLANQGHDHENEQIFFKGELLSRRWHADRPWHVAFWFGIVYQILSDFGRSLLRPLFGWALCLAVFAAVYLSPHQAFQPPERSFVDRMTTMELTTMPLECEEGVGNPISAAFDLSVRNALLFVGQTSRDKLRQNYVCLYGHETKVSHFVVFMEHLQNVISAILIFLFLLGIRNHFKIK